MFEHYLAALFSLRQMQDLGYSARPDAPLRSRRLEAAPADPPVVAGPNGSSQWDPCPCRQWGVARDDRHGCVALCKELFPPQLDTELDAWEAEHGWLYR